jgi:thioesterase domain-containing protein
MVDCYVRAIRARQPHGPYAIAGYSYGGVLAFEMAKVLEAAGERVGFIGIISQTPHIRTRMRGTTFMARAASLAQFLGLISKDQAAGPGRGGPGQLGESRPLAGGTGP